MSDGVSHPRGLANETVTAHLAGIGVLLLVATSPVGSGVGEFMFVKTAALQAWLTGVAALTAATRTELVLPTRSRVTDLAMLVGIISLASAAGTSRVGHSLVQTLIWLTGGVAFLLVCQGRRQGEIVLGWVFASGVLTAGLGLVQYLFPYSPVLAFIPQAVPPAATFGNTNVATHIVVPAWVAGVVLARPGADPAHPARTLITGLGIALCLAFIVISEARSAWLAAGVQIVLLVSATALRADRPPIRLFQRGQVLRHRRLWIVPVLVFLLLINVDHTGLRPITELVELNVDESARDLALSDQSPSERPYVRLSQWTGAVRVAAQHPLLGAGPDTLQTAHAPHATAYTYRSRYAHNDYLQILAETGVTGFLAIVGLAVLAGPLAFRRALGKQAVIPMVGAVAVTGVLVQATLSFPLQWIGPVVLVGVLGAMGSPRLRAASPPLHR